MKQNIAQTIESSATAITYGVSGSTLFLGLTKDEWGIAASVVGILGVIATFAFNAWWKIRFSERRRDSRAE